MSAHETLIEPIAAAPKLEPAVISAPAVRRRRWVAYAGYAGLVWLGAEADVSETTLRGERVKG
jgi:hypothetical protein